MKNITLLFFIALLNLNHFSACAHSSKILQVRTIAIALYGVDVNGELSGIYYDLANSLLAKVKLESEHHIFPYGRIMHELKIGKTDLAIILKYK
jgi:polar amino acid transport system substrate-binding protein